MMKPLSILLAIAIGIPNLACHADEVIMAFGEKIPPFCFPETNSGIELEVIGEALAYSGHTLKPKYFAFARVPVAFKNKTVDAAMTDLGENLTSYGAYYGDPAVIYDNVFIVLQGRKRKNGKDIDIRTASDLDGLTVLSFQGAANRYPDWLRKVKKEGRYFEQNDQALQVLALDNGRYDLVLSDRHIFKYFTLKLKRERNVRFKSNPIKTYKFVKLNPMDYRPIFRSKEIRDDFNYGLKKLKESGRYQAIYDRYLEE